MIRLQLKLSILTGLLHALNVYHFSYYLAKARRKYNKILRDEWMNREKYKMIDLYGNIARENG